MDSNRFEGAAKNLVGKAEQAFGELTGKKDHESDGYRRRAEGSAQNMYGRAMDQVRDTACEVSHTVERNPLVSLLVAGAVGYLLAVLMRD